MRIKRLAIELVPLLLVIPLVMFVFWIIPERRIAAVIAGALFVGVPLALLLRRAFGGSAGQVAGSAFLWWAGILQFWILFAVPILGSRLLWWNEPFESFHFFGQSADRWHQLSSKSYMVMLVLILVAHGLQWRQSKK